MTGREELLSRAQGWLTKGQPDRLEHDMQLLCAREPNNVRAQFLRGVALHLLGRIDDALAAFEAVLAIDPHHVQAHSARAGMLHRLGNAVAAEQAFIAALERMPDDEHAGPDIPDPRIVYLIIAHRRLCSADWCDFERQGQVFTEVAMDDALRATLPDLMGLMFRSYVWPVPCEARTRLASRCAAQVRARAAPRLWVADPVRRDERLRIGYLSGDFRLHPGAMTLLPVLQNHDRRRFHVTAYVLNQDDGSALGRKILAAADSVLHLHGLDDHEVAWRIHETGCDLLVYRAGYTYGTRPGILAQRPAPLQLTWAGYHATMGGGLNDYHVSEALSDPPEDSHLWAEARVFLPYGPLSIPHPGHTAPAPLPSRQCHDLPASGIVFAAMHRAEKIDPDLFACWMRLLHAVPDAVLWLLEGTAELRDSLHVHAQAHGIAAQRLVFAPHVGIDAHLDRLSLADIWLDTRWFGSHTTMHDALAVGVPAISCTGNAVHGRIGRAILHAAGLSELVSTTLEEYQRTGLRLARDAQERDAIRAWLRRRDAPLFDVAALTRSLESGYEQIWQRHRDGLRPCDLHVSADAYRASNSPPPPTCLR